MCAWSKDSWGSPGGRRWTQQASLTAPIKLDRVAVRQRGEYYLRGWRRERIWSDFVAMGGETDGRPSVLVFETKGDHLAGNDDSEYNKRVFDALEETFNAAN